MQRYKITVQKPTPSAARRGMAACPMLRVGDEFVCTGSALMPKGFCPWAWIDISGSLGDRPGGFACRSWRVQGGKAVDCCAQDGRPVVFAIEDVADQPPAKETDFAIPRQKS